MKRPILAIGLAAALPLAAAAQQQKPSSAPGTIMKNRAPVSHEVLEVKLPRPQEADLPNGLHLMVLEDHRAPLVNMQLVIDGAGGYYDPADMPGLATFTASLMREGTTHATSEDLSRAIDRLAASLTVSASMTSPFATASASALSDQTDTVLRLLADVIEHPAFSEEEVARYRTRTRAALAQQRTQPSFLAQERLDRALFGEHPASRVAPSPAALDALTRDALVKFHDAHYSPNHAVLAVAGDTTMADMRRKAEAAFADWHASDAAVEPTREPSPVSGPSVALVARPNSVQTTLLVGAQAIDRNDPDYPALSVANHVLGATTGRLFEHLREQKGYTYGAYSAFTAGLFRGPWRASTVVRTSVTDPALTDLLAEIATMRDTAVPEKELADHRRAIVASFARSLESPTTVLDSYIDVYEYKLPADYWDRYPEQIDHVTAADVQRVAQKYWAADRLQVVAVGDAATIRSALAKVGTVREFDADGKPVNGGQP